MFLINLLIMKKFNKEELDEFFDYVNVEKDACLGCDGKRNLGCMTYFTCPCTKTQQLRFKENFKNKNTAFIFYSRTNRPDQDECINALKNLIGFLDTPLGRKKFNNEHIAESISIAKDVLKRESDYGESL
jgi:hypothetical protein